VCGLSGFLTAARLPDPLADTARRMADTLTHRGPDDAGVWVDRVGKLVKRVAPVTSALLLHPVK
jgi:asparagine synthase (glutamine-hydrolysing)